MPALEDSGVTGETPGKERSARRGLVWGTVLFTAVICCMPVVAAGVPSGGDTPVYRSVAIRLTHGQVAYRDVPIEYPPLALAAFVSPLAVASSPRGYLRAFAVIMALCMAVAGLATVAAGKALGWGVRGQLAAGLAVVVTPVVGNPFLHYTRFDAWPVCLVAVAAALTSQRRLTLAGGVLGMAVAAKFWPVVLVLPLAGVAWRLGGRRRLAAVLSAAGMTAGIPIGLAALMSFSGLLASFRYQVNRPLQLESTGASLLVLAHQRLGIGPALHIVDNFGSQNLGGHTAAAVATVSAVAATLALAVVSMVGLRQVARAPAGLLGPTAARYGLAAVVALLAFGKVLSPQFLLWLVPLPVFLAGRRRLVVGAGVLLALVLTNVENSNYDRLRFALDPGIVDVVAARNIVLVLLLFALLMPGVHRWPDLTSEPPQ